MAFHYFDLAAGSSSSDEFNLSLQTDFLQAIYIICFKLYE